MYRALLSGIPKDPEFPADLKKLGYEFTEDGRIQSVEDPQKPFRFRVSRDERTNNKHREAVLKCVREEVMSRMEKLGLQKVHLPGFNAAEPLGPHTTILSPPLKVLKKRRRIIVIVNDMGKNLAELSEQIPLSEQALKTSTFLGFILEMIARSHISSEKTWPGFSGASSESDPRGTEYALRNKNMCLWHDLFHDFYLSEEDDPVAKAASKMRRMLTSTNADVAESYAKKMESTQSRGTPGVLILNPGQRLYSHELGEIMTERSWTNRKRPSKAHERHRVDAKYSFVQGHTIPEEHVRTVFRTVLRNRNLVSHEAEIYVVGLAAGADAVLRVLDMDWSKYVRSVKGVALIAPSESPDCVRNPEFLRFLRHRARSWIFSDKPANEFITAPFLSMPNNETLNVRESTELVEGTSPSSTGCCDWLETVKNTETDFHRGTETDPEYEKRLKAETEYRNRLERNAGHFKRYEKIEDEDLSGTENPITRVQSARAVSGIALGIAQERERNTRIEAYLAQVADARVLEKMTDQEGVPKDLAPTKGAGVGAGRSELAAPTLVSSQYEADTRPPTHVREAAEIIGITPSTPIVVPYRGARRQQGKKPIGSEAPSRPASARSSMDEHPIFPGPAYNFPPKEELSPKNEAERRPQTILRATSSTLSSQTGPLQTADSSRTLGEGVQGPKEGTSISPPASLLRESEQIEPSREDASPGQPSPPHAYSADVSSIGSPEWMAASPPEGVEALSPKGVAATSPQGLGAASPEGGTAYTSLGLTEFSPAPSLEYSDTHAEHYSGAVSGTPPPPKHARMELSYYRGDGVFCPTFSGGQTHFVETIFPTICGHILDFFEDEARGGDTFRNPQEYEDVARVRHHEEKERERQQLEDTRSGWQFGERVFPAEGGEGGAGEGEAGEQTEVAPATRDLGRMEKIPEADEEYQDPTDVSGGSGNGSGSGGTSDQAAQAKGDAILVPSNAETAPPEPAEWTKTESPHEGEKVEFASSLVGRHMLERAGLSQAAEERPAAGPAAIEAEKNKENIRGGRGGAEAAATAAVTAAAAAAEKAEGAGEGEGRGGAGGNVGAGGAEVEGDRKRKREEEDVGGGGEGEEEEEEGRKDSILRPNRMSVDELLKKPAQK